ncbi:MAG TPA: DUF4157 domain-containing protein [Longimicrobium sp.]
MRTHERKPHLAQHGDAATIPLDVLSRRSRGPSFGAPGDRSEQDADLAAAQVTGAADRGGGTGEQGRGTLSPDERAFYETRFGHDFSRVRIHDDARAARMADAMGAEAFTFGRDIFFGAGMRQPRGGAGDRLMAHELAHVVQQSHAGPALQPKLKFTGKPDHTARAVALLNANLGSFYHVSIDAKTGEVTMAPIRAAHTSSIKGPDPQVKALADRLWTVTSDSKDVVMTVSAGSQTIVGSWATGDFDIDDIEKVGVGALIHEIVEQHQKQAKGEKNFGTATTGAHGVASKAESEVTGMTRGADKVISMTQNADGTVDGVIETTFTTTGGQVKTMVSTLKSNNIVSITWK